MMLDGHRAEILEDARGTNHVLIPELRSGRLYEWMLYSGLTQEECALIQPSYPWQARRTDERSDWIRAAIKMHLMRVHDFLSTPEQTVSSLALAARRLPDPTE